MNTTSPKPSNTTSKRIVLAHVAVALFFLTLAGIMAWQIGEMPTSSGYSGVSARMVPSFVGGGLLLVGLVLLYQAMTGGFRGASHEGAGTQPNVAAVLWIVGGLVCFMLFAKTIGFVLAAMILFASTARGFGSLRWKADVAWGFALGMAAYLFFNRILGVDLPAGVFKWLF